jgi:hypothetical protein
MDTTVPVGFPRTVFDPDIPERDRRLLAAQSGDLIPAHRPLPPRGRRPLFDAFSRAARTYHGRYLCPTDFDGEGIYLLARAQVAIEAIERTDVYRSGYLGTFENALVLDQYLWEIAQTLRTHTVLRAEQSAVAAGRAPTPELRAILAPQREALWRSAAIVTERIKALEHYAERVADADVAFRAQLQLQNNDKYRDLLARTGDEAGLAALTDRARYLHAALSESVRQAIAAGQTLALPPF